MRKLAIVVVAGLTLAGIGGTAAPAYANSRPEVQNDFYSMAANTTLTVPAPGVLGNDVDPDGDPITIYEDLLPGGEVDLELDGSFTFTPPPDYSGVYSFDYYAFDGQIVNDCCAHVYISIYPDAVANDDSYGALTGTPRVVPSPGVLTNDVGVAAVLVSQPAHGTVDLRRNGRFVYTSDPGYTGTDSVRYRTWSGFERQLSAPATVTLQVKASNVRPTAVADTYETFEDNGLEVAAPGVLDNDMDADGDALTVELVSEPFGDFFDLRPDGSFEYWPPSNYDSPVTFVYRIHDGLTYSAPVTSTIEIHFVNDSPTAVEDEYYVDLSGHLTVPAPGVLANDYDEVEGDGLLAVLITAPTKGTLTLNSNGSFSYIRTPGTRGIDRFIYRVDDSGGAIGNTATVTIYRGTVTVGR